VTEKEAKKIVMLFLTAFPNLRDLPDEVRKGVNKVWADELANIPFAIGVLAAREVLREQTIPAFPAVGRIIQKAARLSLGNVPTAIEAWESIRRAVSATKEGCTAHSQEKVRITRFDSRSEAELCKSEFLHPLTAEVVRLMGWSSLYWTILDGGDNYNIVRSQFVKLYDNQLLHHIEIRAMLPETRAALGITGLPEVKAIVRKEADDATE